MSKRFLFLMVATGLVLSACGRDCPVGVNYTDPSCAGFVGTGYTNNNYQYPQQQIPGQIPGQFPGQYPQQYQQYPNGYYPPQQPYQQPYYQPTQVPPNPYQYPCDPRNPYCY